MKKLLALLLVGLLSIGSFACGANTSSVAQSELAQKIQKLCTHQTVKTILSDKKISDLIKESVQKMGDKEKEDAQKYGISLDPSNFNSDESTYSWLADAVQKSVKYSITSGQLTQEQYDQARAGLTLMGISMPELKISDNLSDKDLSNICLSFVDVAERFLDPNVLKMLGIDINNPETLSNLTKQFNIGG